MVGASLTEHVRTTLYTWMTACLAHPEFLPTALDFAIIRIMLVVGVAALAAYS